MSIGVNLSSVNSDYWGGERHIIGHSLSYFPFHPIATSPELGGVGCKAVPVGAPYSLAADAGKSDLCGRVERDGLPAKSYNWRAPVTDSGHATSSSG